MSRWLRQSRPHEKDFDRWGGQGTASPLLLLAVGVTAGLALVLGARRGLRAPRRGQEDRMQHPVRDEDRNLSSGSRVGVGRSRVRSAGERPAVGGAELERRVLVAFRNDPILSERSIDIGAMSAGGIELTGWVDAPQEVAYARILARGVPGVRRVIEQLEVLAVQDAPLARVPRAD